MRITRTVPKSVLLPHNAWIFYSNTKSQQMHISSTIATGNNTGMLIIHYSTEHIAFSARIYIINNNYNFNLVYRYPLSVNLTLSITV